MSENPLRKQVVLSIFPILTLLCLALVRTLAKLLIYKGGKKRTKPTKPKVACSNHAGRVFFLFRGKGHFKENIFLKLFQKDNRENARC